MAKNKGKSALSTPMSSAPWQKISLHGNTTVGTNVANGPTQAAMIKVKATPAVVSSPMGDFPNRKNKGK